MAHWMQIKKGISNGKSYISLDKLQFHRPLAEAAEAPRTGRTGLVQALLFEVGDRDLIGTFSSSGDRSFCCSHELVRRTGCTPGKLIYTPRSADDQWPRVIDMNFFGNDTVLDAAPSTAHITRDGMYHLWFIVCDKTLGGLSVTGQTVWKNPTGYLPGMMAPLMTFFGFMSLLYLILGVVWFIQYCRFYTEILQLQNAISIVIFLAMGEMAMWYFDYVNFNATGDRPYLATLWAVTLGSLNKTVSRMLILVVSMGYGVVRPTLGGLTNKVLLLGGGYFLAAELFDVLQNAGAIDDLNNGERVFLVLPVALLDAVFILWIFTSLSKTLLLLQAKRTTNKLEMYRRFTNGMAVAVVIAVGWIIFEVYFRFHDKFNEHWQVDWILSSFWYVFDYLILCGICILWSPSQSATRYAYSEDVGDELADEETVALTEKHSNEDKADSKDGPSSSSSAPNAAAASSSKDKKVNTDVFSLDDEQEESKLE